MKPMTRQIGLLGQFSYLGLLILQPLWYLWLTLPEKRSITSAVCMSIPLLIPMHGILRNNPYTFAWAQFIVLFYMVHAITVLYTERENNQWLALAELILTLGSLVFCTLFAKLRGRELGLSIRTKK